MEAIEAAVEKFRKLLTEQCERAEKMKNPPAQKRADGKIRIGLIDGDGIGRSSCARRKEFFANC